MKNLMYWWGIDVSWNRLKTNTRLQEQNEGKWLFFSSFLFLLVSMDLDMKYARSSFKPTQCKRNQGKMERVQQRKGHWCDQELEQMAFKGEAETHFRLPQSWEWLREEVNCFFPGMPSKRSVGINNKLHQGITCWAKGKNFPGGCPPLARAMHWGWKIQQG